MKPGIILNKWNLVQDGLIVAQCYATTLYEANMYFEDANLECGFREIKLVTELT
jgi:hypothetical protein